MSVPARAADALRPRRSPSGAAGASQPKRRTARQPAASLPRPSRRTRRGSTPFWVVTGVLITALIVGVVSLSALLVQASFREQDLRVDLTTLAEERDRLALEAVALSSPGRVASWARGEGMVVAERVEVLHVRAVSR